jgi:hypothetical protein
LVRNTKAKIKRAAKNYGIDISKDIVIPKLSDFKTRKEFNEFKEKQKSFTSPSNLKYQFVKNEHGVVASKAELNEIKRNTKRAQEIADKLRKEAVRKPFISGGKKQGTVGQRMMQMNKPDTAGISRPPDFDFNKIRNKRDLERKKDNVEKRSKEDFFDKRMEQMKKNFIALLELSFNSDAERLIEKLEGIPPEDFYEMYLMFDEFDFDLYYTQDFNGQSHDSQIRQLESYIDRYYNGNINMDLKSF